MPALQVNTTRYQLSPNGRLTTLSDWNEDVAHALAEREGIELTDAHWEILCVMRVFYQDYNISPIRKLLKRSIAERLGPEKATDDYLNRLFPGSVEVQGTRVAGLPEPLLDAERDQSFYTTAQVREPAVAGHFVDEFEFEGEKVAVFSHGNLVHPEQWNERLAEFMAAKEHLELTREHWEVLRFLRQFYFQYGISPMKRLLMKHMEGQFGAEKSSEEYLYELFPQGPARQGSRIAGLPEPQGCIDP
jgi:TusE/DsrC/DsvC family sulfur relay protein